MPNSKTPSSQYFCEAVRQRVHSPSTTASLGPSQTGRAVRVGGLGRVRGIPDQLFTKYLHDFPGCQVCLSAHVGTKTHSEAK